MRMAALAEFAALVPASGVIVFLILGYARTKFQLSAVPWHTGRYEHDATMPVLAGAAYRAAANQSDAGIPPASPVHRALFVVDIENSTAKPDPVKARLRRVLYHLLGEALRTSGISPDDCDRLVDRGDGVLILIKPADHIPKLTLFTVLVPTLEDLVERHNRDNPELVLRLRMAVHAGEVHHDEQGPFGEAVDLTCRLLDAPELKAALKHASSSTVLAVSQHLYEVIIVHHYDGIDATMYSPLIRVELVGTPRQGWLRTTAGPS
jgi:class 3 adenylate cyclase